MPTGRIMPPVPGTTGLFEIDTVGLPPTPVPLATSIWLLVPVIVADVTAPAVDSATRPLKLAFAKFRTWPLKATVGSPDTPEPLVTDKPAPEEATERPVMAVEDVLTCMPVPDATKDDKAPVVLILKSPCAPPSVTAKPLVAPTYRLFASWGVCETVR